MGFILTTVKISSKIVVSHRKSEYAIRGHATVLVDKASSNGVGDRVIKKGALSKGMKRSE